MIKDDFYTSVITTDTIELTDTITNLNLTDSTTDPAHAYYMGAITGDAAKLFTPKQLYIDAENVGFRDSGVTVNWGIMDDGSSSYAPGDIFYNRSQNKWVSGIRFINKLNACSTRVPGGVSLSFSYQAKHTVEQSTIGSIVYGDRAQYFNRQIENVSMTAQQFYDFIENDTAIVVNNCTIKYSTMIDGKYWEETYNNITYIITLIGFIQGSWQSYYTPDTFYHPNPFIGVKYGADTVLRRKGYIGANTSTLSEILLDFNGHAYCRSSYYNSDSKTENSSHNIPTNAYVSCTGDLKYNINKIDWSDRQTYPVVLFADDFSGIALRNTSASNVTIDGVSYTRFIVCPILRLIDVYKYFCIFWRTSANGATTTFALYSTGDLITLYDSANNPIRKLVFADYASIENRLRPWQKYGHDISENDYDPDNPPSPIPPRPEPEPPGDSETDGDDADMNDPAGIGNGFGFTTMYGIRASHLSEIGAKLWSGFSDVTDYINNFVFAVDPTTGSVNLSDIMQFFISLRAYPCPLSAMATTSAGGTDMYIGSGAAPLSLTTPFSIVDSYIGHIDAGSVDIPFWYGDYRDYALEIICYLPYCGTVQLNAGDVMGGTLSAYYTVDFCSGACTAYVLCTTWEDKTILVGSLPGQLGADIPMTATNAGQVMARMYGDRINVAENLLGTAKNAATGIGAIMSGNFAGAIRSGISAFIDPAIGNERQLAEMGSRSAIAAPMLSGGRGLAAFGTSKSAYVQIRSPYYTEPANYDHAVGTPAASAVRIGDCTGYCQFVNVDVSGITADADDQNAIRAALESGIII